MKVKPKKHLGQHFLNDKNIAGKIVEALSGNNYTTALEVGPGMGVLTQFLLKREFRTIVAEIDTESVEYLKINFPDLQGNIVGDFLKLNFDSVCEGDMAVIGNFPYNISSQIIFKVLDNKTKVPEVVGMFQKEVAERIAAQKGNKIYGILSVLTQAYYHTEYLFTVHENVFTPPPKVKSAVIKLTRYRTEIEGIDEKLFVQIVKAGFNQRRKTLRNALKAMGIPESLEAHEFMALRAEQLSVEDFIQLARIWK